LFGINYDEIREKEGFNLTIDDKQLPDLKSLDAVEGPVLLQQFAEIAVAAEGQLLA